ncbi:hypothetical protein FHS66_002618 [Pacificitalea manganoxidans]|nr:hypothetical protein [Pacificitalea manganoxidans]
MTPEGEFRQSSCQDTQSLSLVWAGTINQMADAADTPLNPTNCRKHP